jgi:hypothetical protein
MSGPTSLLTGRLAGTAPAGCPRMRAITTRRTSPDWYPNSTTARMMTR